MTYKNTILWIAGFALMSIATSITSHADTYHLNTTAAGWQSVQYNSNHPYWYDLVTAIEETGNHYSSNPVSDAFDPELTSLPLNFQIVDQAKIQSSGEIALQSEFYHFPSFTFARFFDVHSTTILTGTQQWDDVSWGGSPANPLQNYHNPATSDLTTMVHFQVGHQRYNNLCAKDMEVWEIVWEVGYYLNNDIIIKPLIYYDYVDDIGTPIRGFTFDLGEKQGFAIAWALYQTNQPLNETFRNFFRNLRKTGASCILVDATRAGQNHNQNGETPVTP